MTSHIHRTGYPVLIAAVFVVMVILYARIDYASGDYADWDLKHYLAMAEASPHLPETVPQPYAYRILGPYVAGLLPLPAHLALYLLAVVSSAGLVALFYLFLRRIEIEPRAAAITAMLFMFNRYMFGFTLWDYFQLNDILALLALVVSLRAMYMSRWGLFTLALLLGVLCRETMLIMIPVSLVYIVEKKETGQDFRKWLPAAVLTVAAFLAVRFAVTPAGGPNLWESFLRHAPKLTSPGAWYGLTVSGFIPLSLLPLIYSGETIRFFRKSIHLLFLAGLVFLSALFGSNNERLMAPAFVAFYPLTAMIIQESVGKSRGLVTLILAVSFISSFDFMSGAIRLPGRKETMILAVACLALVTLVAAIFRILEKRKVKTA